MQRTMVCVIGVVLVLMGCGAPCFGDEGRCAEKINKINKKMASGDIMMAKLLMGYVTGLESEAGCTKSQKAQLKQLRFEVHSAYIIDRLHSIKRNILEHNDGHSALIGIASILKAAEEIDVELKGIDGLMSMAFLAAAIQNIEEAQIAEQNGDIGARDGLRDQAKQFLEWASALDPRVDKLIKEALKP